jgi:hypothetical protein
MNTFFDDINLYSIIEIKNDKNKYCVVGKDENNNSIYIRIILKNEDDYYVGKNKTKINFHSYIRICFIHLIVN